MKFDVKAKLSTNIIIGILLVVVAIGYIGNVFEVWNFTLFFPGWWTMLIIIPAVVSIAGSGFSARNCGWLVIGGLLFVRQSGILPSWLSKLFVPLIILAIGFFIILRAKDGKSSPLYVAIFSGRTPNFNGKEFTGAICAAIFGGVDLKLKEATIKDGATIDVLVIFGGVDVILPEGVNAEVACIPLFGGISESDRRVHDTSNPTVKINALCVFGGGSVK